MTVQFKLLTSTCLGNLILVHLNTYVIDTSQIIQDRKTALMPPYYFNHRIASEKRSAHEANKKEMFDGMRAYHLSEINHKKDGIDILKTYLVTLAGVFGGLLASINKGYISNAAIIGLAILIAVINAIAVGLITWFTNQKIMADNGVYNRFLYEHGKERELLGIEDDLRTHTDYKSPWQKAEAKSEIKGYSHTIRIMRVFGNSVIAIGVVAALVVWLAVKNIKPPENKGQPIQVEILGVNKPVDVNVVDTLNVKKITSDLPKTAKSKNVIKSKGEKN